MAEGRSRLLLLEHRVAPRAMAAFGKAGRRTRRRNGRIRHGIVAERFDLHIRRVIAAGTGIVGIPTDLGTRCRFCFVMFEIMAKRGAFIRSRIGDFAAIALCGLRSVLGTRCIVVRDIARKAMAERCSFFYSFSCFSATATDSRLRSILCARCIVVITPIRIVMPQCR